MIRGMITAAALMTTSVALAAPQCDGQMITMRVSKLKPGGTAAGFADAVRANGAWYKAKGLSDSIVLAQSLVPAKGGSAPSATQFVTLHTSNAPRGPKPATDAGWKAFVAKYAANSTIVTENRMCLPKGAALTMR